MSESVEEAGQDFEPGLSNRVLRSSFSDRVSWMEFSDGVLGSEISDSKFEIISK